MSKQETQIIKGIALLMMLWLHLFSNVAQTQTCTNLINIGGIPLASILARACPPVDFFIFCGGYGLYYTYRKGNDKRYLPRIVKLFIAYWLILLIFIPACICFADANFPMDTKSIVFNITGLHCDWDHPTWFLLPYSLLSLSYPFLFRLFDKIRVRYVLVVTFVLNFMMMTLLHFYGTSHINNNPLLSIPVCYIEFLFPFVCGASLLRCNLVPTLRIKQAKLGRLTGVIYAMFALILILTCTIINSAAIHSIYILGVIGCLLLSPFNRAGAIPKLLAKIGDHSMNMWLIHAILYGFLFKDLIYGISYPVFGFLALILLSYICSIGINAVLKPIYKIVQFK